MIRRSSLFVDAPRIAKNTSRVSKIAVIQLYPSLHTSMFIVASMNMVRRSFALDVPAPLLLRDAPVSKILRTSDLFPIHHPV